MPQTFDCGRVMVFHPLPPPPMVTALEGGKGGELYAGGMWGWQSKTSTCGKVDGLNVLYS